MVFAVANRQRPRRCAGFRLRSVHAVVRLKNQRMALVIEVVDVQRKAR